MPPEDVVVILFYAIKTEYIFYISPMVTYHKKVKGQTIPFHFIYGVNKYVLPTYILEIHAF